MKRFPPVNAKFFIVPGEGLGLSVNMTADLAYEKFVAAEKSFGEVPLNGSCDWDVQDGRLALGSWSVPLSDERWLEMACAFARFRCIVRRLEGSNWGTST